MNPDKKINLQIIPTQDHLHGLLFTTRGKSAYILRGIIKGQKIYELPDTEKIKDVYVKLDFLEQALASQRKEIKQDINSVLSMLGGIEDEKARKIENFIKEYLSKD